MTQSELKFSNLIGKIMVAVGLLGTVVTVLFRVWLFPGVISSTNGLLDSPWTVMGFMLLCTVGLLVLANLMGGIRRELTGGASAAMGLSALVAALLLAYSEGCLFYDSVSLGETMNIMQGVLGVFSAVALGVLGFRLLSEGGTRRGMSQWSMLLPVLWMWMRLINYEMSAGSLARLEDSFFGFGMLVLELLFLFKFARYIAGVGIVRTGFMVFYSVVAALFALSAVATSVYFYLTNDGMSVNAYHLADAADFAVGILAFVVGVTQLFGEEQIQTEEFELPEEESAGEDLIMSSNDEDASDVIAE